MSKFKEIHIIRRNNFLRLIKSVGRKEDIAKKIDCYASYISAITKELGVKGSRNIGETAARKIELAFDLPKYSLDNINYTDGQFIDSEFNPELSNAKLGIGFDFIDKDEPLGKNEVELYFLREFSIGNMLEVKIDKDKKRRFLKSDLQKDNVLQKNAVCIHIEGNSMEPVLPDGSVIAVDTSKTEIISGKVYAIDQNGELRVKVVYKLPGGTIRLRSFNANEWPDEEYKNTSSIKILGKMFYAVTYW